MPRVDGVETIVLLYCVLQPTVSAYICTAGNYDYAFYWYFYQDGMIEHEIKATGIMQTQAVRPGQSPQYGTLVAPQLGARISWSGTRSVRPTSRGRRTGP
jgi:Copper amine oxidase, enzyme domain